MFAGALIKKRRYWPGLLPGDTIDVPFSEKEVRSCESLRGTMENVPYDILCMRKPLYVMKIMDTC